MEIGGDNSQQDAYDSSGEDSDLPALPDYLCVTPVKKEDQGNDRDTTPPLLLSTTNFMAPLGDPLPGPSYSLSPFNAYTISPVRLQKNVVQNNAKEEKTESRLLEKNRNRILVAMEQRQREEKISEFGKSGGILAISKETEENISKVKEEIRSQPAQEQVEQDLQRQNKIDIPEIPGVPYFINPPKFCKGFIPFPDTSDQLPISKIAIDIQSVYQLMFVLNGKPCDSSVIYWLMDNSCLSEDIMVRRIASNALARIASISSSLSSKLSFECFRVLLSKLGVDSAAKQESHMRSERQESKLLLNSVTNFCKGILIIFENFSSVSADSLLVKHLILVLLDIALDPLVCSDFTCDDVCSCLQMMITCVSDDGWPEINKEIISHCSFISDHRNQQYIVTLMSSSFTRISSLQRSLAQTFLSKQCCSEGDDCELVTQVVSRYIGVADMSYGELLSTMKMVAIFIQPPKMNWSTDSKNNFISLLSKLASSIRDNAPDLVVERGPVKDFIISLKFELQNGNAYGGKKQTTLFDFY